MIEGDSLKPSTLRFWDIVANYILKDEGERTDLVYTVEPFKVIYVESEFVSRFQCCQVSLKKYSEICNLP